MLGGDLKPSDYRRYRVIKRWKDANHGGLFTPVYRGQRLAARRAHTTMLNKLTEGLDDDETDGDE